MTTFEIIKKLSQKRSITLKQLSDDLGFGESTIYKWKNQIPKTEYLEMVADYFNVTVDYLLGREKNEEPVSFFRIDTTNLTEDEVNELQDELEEYQEFLKQRIKNKRNRMD
ncbi:MAG: helix-turn-helix transcriptional regulator [Vagococcus sp.]|uniref:helix-turn-helix domain-containing protein n=1 Tax=Vagococcus sp. TaxID=1933889 RepID=UPI002FC66CA6